MYFVLNLINTKSTLLNNQKVHIEDLCYRPVKGKGCYRPSIFIIFIQGPLDLWKMDIADLQGDK